MVVHLMPNPFYTYVLNIYDLVWFGWVGFYGISTIICHLMPNPLYTYIYIIYMKRFGWVLWYIISSPVYLCSFQITNGVKQCTTCLHSNYSDTAT